MLAARQHLHAVHPDMRHSGRILLRLGEGRERLGGRIDAKVVEEGEVENQQRQQCAGEAEQQPRRANGRLVDVGGVGGGMTPT